MKIKLLINALIFILLVSNASASIHLEPKMVTSPVDTTYTVGSSGNTLIWRFEANEANDAPSKYSITIDGANIAGHTLTPWEDNVNIIVDIDNLDLGVHVVHITVNDTGTDIQQAPATEHSVNVSVVNTTVTVATVTTTTGSSSPTTITTSLPILTLPIIFSLLFLSRFKRKLN